VGGCTLVNWGNSGSGGLDVFVAAGSVFGVAAGGLLGAGVTGGRVLFSGARALSLLPGATVVLSPQPIVTSRKKEGATEARFMRHI